MWKLNGKHINLEIAQKKNHSRILKCFEINKAHQNLWNETKAV